MNTVRIICRQSRLSLLQAEIVKQKTMAAEPGTMVEIIGRSSRGDRELSIPLSSLDGTDFFTEEIFEALEKNEADIAVHSLKDMSAPHFFSHNAFAIVDRDDARDVAIFNNTIEQKIENGETIVVGTCSPRREEMAIVFLKKALPQLAGEIKIETKSIRGNVESRLRQLNDGGFDATILATAGLNRLLRSEQDAGLIKDLLKEKRLMVLPLIECVPAPCQGIIVAEAHPENKEAVALLKKINDVDLFVDAFNEKQEAYKYGSGCLQRFGVATLKIAGKKIMYAAGKNKEGKEFSTWSYLPLQDIKADNLFSSIDHMRDFFEYEWKPEKVVINQPVVFIANYKILQNEQVKGSLLSKTIWASGTKTWFELAKQGYWVQGCADALGFERLLPVLNMPLLTIRSNDVCILTHEEAAKRWEQKGYHAVSNYKLVPANNKAIASGIASADYIFWSSYSQYEYYGQFAKQGVTHLCAGGETASLLKKQGIEPVLFPTIKAFEQWRKSFSRPLSVA